jgi:hypothetical protein
MDAGCGEAMIRLHICRRSAFHVSMGPRLVAAQSMLLAKRMCGGIESVIGNRVQSKDGESEATMSMWLLARSEEREGEAATAAFRAVTYVEGEGIRSVAPERSSSCGWRAPLTSYIGMS